jgi:hypothetical protein
MPPVQKRARISQDDYERLRDAFLEVPGNVAQAARKVGVSEKTAKRAWETGWPRPQWAVPIKPFVESELEKRQLDVRARLATSEVNVLRAKEETRKVVDRELAKIDAIEEQSREAKFVRAAFSAAINSQAIAAVLGQAAVPIVQRATRDLVADVNAGRVSWSRALQIAKDVVALAKEAGTIGLNAQVALRRHLGEPEKIIAQVDGSGIDGRVIDVLGSEDEVRSAIYDLAEGRMSDRVLRLIEFKAGTARN